MRKKMKIIILGSCSGTEPVTPRHQTSWILETEKSIYFFDTGECCSYTAYRMGLDLLKTKRIFFSHPHLDHVAGLPHLLFLFRKIQTMEERTMTPPAIHTPHIAQTKAFIEAAEFAENGNFYSAIGLERIKDGVIFRNEEITVEALHNRHLEAVGDGRNGLWQSFSFKILCEGKTILFSGDVKGLEDLKEWPGEADIFLMETGHHDPLEICRKLSADFPGASPHLLFMHHGRRILHNKPFYEEECPKLYKGRITIAEDGMILEE